MVTSHTFLVLGVLFLTAQKYGMRGINLYTSVTYEIFKDGFKRKLHTMTPNSPQIIRQEKIK